MDIDLNTYVITHNTTTYKNIYIYIKNNIYIYNTKQKNNATTSYVLEMCIYTVNYYNVFCSTFHLQSANIHVQTKGGPRGCPSKFIYEQIC